MRVMVVRGEAEMAGRIMCGYSSSEFSFCPCLGKRREADGGSDEVHAMRHVACDQSGFVEHKMCELDSFLETQNWAMEEVDWGVCYRD